MADSPSLQSKHRNQTHVPVDQKASHRKPYKEIEDIDDTLGLHNNTLIMYKAYRLQHDARDKRLLMSGQNKTRIRTAYIALKVDARPGTNQELTGRQMTVSSREAEGGGSVLPQGKTSYKHRSNEACTMQVSYTYVYAV